MARVLAPHLTLPAHDFWPTSHAERPEDGESFEDVIARVGLGLERLAAAHAGEDLVIVCHGGPIRAAMAHVLRLGGDGALRFSVGNISLDSTRTTRAGLARHLSQ